MATIRQIAKACSVSPMTVSFVLNNHTGQVSDETRERVLQVVREMGYRPRVALRRRNEPTTTHTIGIALGNNGNRLSQPGYHSYIVNGIFAITEQREMNILVFHGGLLHADPRRSIRTYMDGQSEGLIVIAPIMGMPLVDALHERGVPFVLVGDQGDRENIASVDIDNVHEAQRIVEYLVRLGHRKIAFIGGVTFVRSACQRREGYIKALERFNLPYKPDWDVSSSVRDHEVYEQTVRLMNCPVNDRPTAIFAWNDGVAVRAVNVMTDMGIKVGEQVSVVGVDDAPQSAISNPPITTLRQPYREIGMRSVELLLERIRDPKAPAQTVFLPCRLIERDSTAPPPR